MFFEILSIFIEKFVNRVHTESPKSYPLPLFFVEKTKILLYTKERKRTFVRLQNGKGEIKFDKKGSLFNAVFIRGGAFGRKGI